MVGKLLNEMRIISGKLKGKPIKYVKSLITRPLKDSVKENIFNILAHNSLFKIDINKANVLDLYSGVGSFGIECISRGANKITFVEKDKTAINLLRENLIALSIQKKADIFEGDISQFFKKSIDNKFEIFFFDPPFKNNNYLDYISLISNKKIFKDNHVVIIHRERKTSEIIDKFLKPILIKEYSRSKIIFGKLFA